MTAQEIAEAVNARARELGADHAIIMIGVSTPGSADDSTYVIWSGRGLAIRGLLAACTDRIMSVLRNSI